MVRLCPALARVVERFSLRVAAVVLAIEVGIALCVLLPDPAKAETIGWRIHARACQDPVLCADFPPSDYLWDADHACRTRAETIAARIELMGHLPSEEGGTFAEAIGLSKGSYTFVIRCVPVEGMPGA